jgi:hypothetical protein
MTSGPSAIRSAFGKICSGPSDRDGDAQMVLAALGQQRGTRLQIEEKTNE